MEKARKIEKVTGSQDDDFVGRLNTTVEYAERSKESQALRVTILWEFGRKAS
jgi:hypothetical protein